MQLMHTCWEEFQQEFRGRRIYKQTSRKPEQQVSLHKLFWLYCLMKDNIAYMLSLDAHIDENQEAIDVTGECDA